MKSFKNIAAQGDLLLRRVASLPAHAKPTPPTSGVFVVAHSETGHNHVITAAPNVSWHTVNDPMVSYLQVIETADATETLLRHLRGHDTHETLVISPGIYEVRRQREYTPEGFRRVED